MTHVRFHTDNMVRVVDMAPTLGIGAGALRRSLRAHRCKVYRVEKHSVVSLQALERLVRHHERYAPIVTRRPQGWLSAAAVADHLDVDVSTVWSLLTRRKLKAVRYKGLYLYDPEVVEHYRLTRPRLLPGWVPLVDVGRMAKLDQKAINDLPRAARALGFVVREFKQESQAQGTKTRQCIRQDDVLALIEARCRKLPADYLPSDELARLAGVSRGSVVRWKAQGLPSEQDWRGHLHLDPLETVAWLRKQARLGTRGAEDRAEVLLENLRRSRECAA